MIAIKRLASIPSIYCENKRKEKKRGVSVYETWNPGGSLLSFSSLLRERLILPWMGPIRAETSNSSSSTDIRMISEMGPEARSSWF